MTFYMATPLIMTALSAALLGEKVERFRWIAVLIGFVGVLIALRPSPHMLSWAAPIALVGATTYALARRSPASSGASTGSRSFFGNSSAAV